jgi:hypothetical protein
MWRRSGALWASSYSVAAVSAALSKLKLNPTMEEWKGLTNQKLRAAYRKCVLEHHPDAVGEGPSATEEFHQTAKAFQICQKALSEGFDWNSAEGSSSRGDLNAQEEVAPTTEAELRRAQDQLRTDLEDQLKIRRDLPGWKDAASPPGAKAQPSEAPVWEDDIWEEGVAVGAPKTPPPLGSGLQGLLQVLVSESSAQKSLDRFQSQLGQLLCGSNTITPYVAPDHPHRRQHTRAVISRFSGWVPRLVARVTKERKKFETTNTVLNSKVRPTHHTVGAHHLGIHQPRKVMGDVGLKPLCLMGVLVILDVPRIRDTDKMTTGTSTHSPLGVGIHRKPVASPPKADDAVVPKTTPINNEAHPHYKYLPKAARQCCPELLCSVYHRSTLPELVSQFVVWEQNSIARYRAETAVGYALETLSTELSCPLMKTIPNLSTPTSIIEEVATKLRSFAIGLVVLQPEDPIRQLMPFSPSVQFDPDEVDGYLGKDLRENVRRLERSTNGSAKALIDDAVRALIVNYESFGKDKSAKGNGQGTSTEVAVVDPPKGKSDDPDSDDPTGDGADEAGMGTDGEVPEKDDPYCISKSKDGRILFEVHRSPLACVAEQIQYDVIVHLHRETELAEWIQALGRALYTVLKRASRSFVLKPRLVMLRDRLVAPQPDSGEKPIQCFPRLHFMEAPTELLFWQRVEQAKEMITAHQRFIRPWKVLLIESPSAGSGGEPVNGGWLEDQETVDVVSIGVHQLQSRDAFIAWLATAIDMSTVSRRVHHLLFSQNLQHIRRDASVEPPEFLQFLENYCHSPARNYIESAFLSTTPNTEGGGGGALFGDETEGDRSVGDETFAPDQDGGGNDSSSSSQENHVGPFPTILVTKVGPVAVDGGMLRIPYWCDLNRLIDVLPTTQREGAPQLDA